MIFPSFGLQGQEAELLRLRLSHRPLFASPAWEQCPLAFSANPGQCLSASHVAHAAHAAVTGEQQDPLLCAIIRALGETLAAAPGLLPWTLPDQPLTTLAGALDGPTLMLPDQAPGSPRPSSDRQPTVPTAAQAMCGFVASMQPMRENRIENRNSRAVDDWGWLDEGPSIDELLAEDVAAGKPCFI